MTTNSDTISVPKTRKPALPRISRKAFLSAFSVLLIAVTGGFGYYKLTYASAQTTTESTLQTAVVRQGDLVIYASGSGTLVAADEVDLAFKTGGQVTDIPVEVGEQVEAGDLLAQVDDTDAQIAYALANRNLLELTSVAAVATAEQNLAQAKIDLEDAINHLEYLISAPVVYWESEIPKAEVAVEEAQAALEAAPSDEAAQAALEDAQDYLDYANAKLVGAWDSYENYYLPNNFTVKSRNKSTGQTTKYVAAPTETDIQEARAAVTVAQATLTEAGYLYDALTGNEVPDDATGASLSELEQAQLDLRAAQADLDGTRIYAPFSGTVMSIDTRVGDTVGSSSTVITLADLSQPNLEIYLDESDWTNVKTGDDVEVTFDILPDQTFSGIVTSVDPGLYTESNSSVVRATVKLNDFDVSTFDLPLGTTAAVDVIGGSAENAILVPVEALHETNGQYTVFVMENGTPTLRSVEVGIQDLVYAEIKSGLNAGDVVSTGITETK